MGESMDNELESRTAGGRESAGTMLRTAREARRLGIDKVSRELHLSARTVGLLERDDYASLPPPAFVRGYLRGYARLLDLPEQEVVDAYNQVAGENPAPELRPVVRGQGEARPASWSGPLGLIVVGVLAIWSYQYWHSSQTSEQTPPPAELSEPLPAEPAANGPVLPEKVEAPLPSFIPAPDASPAPVAGAYPSPTVQPYAPQPQPSAEPALPEADTLVLSFSGESWASVIDAEGKKLLYQTVAKGQVKTVQGKAPFKIGLGRPADTRLEYNGQAYDHGYNSNRSSVRFVVPKERPH
ncbi:MAG: RodZ domain-containing protein [Pseudomonadota bacterium]